MGRADILTKNYVKNKRVFADAFNYYMYDGKKVIDPNKLYEVDTTEVTAPYERMSRESVYSLCRK